MGYGAFEIACGEGDRGGCCRRDGANECTSAHLHREGALWAAVACEHVGELERADDMAGGDQTRELKCVCRVGETSRTLTLTA